MKLSNFCKISTLAVSLAIVGAPLSANAENVGGMVDKIVKFVAKKGASKMCIKGSFFNGVVSIRSFEGRLCDASAGTAGFALSSCLEANTDKFKESGCFKRATAKLGLTGTENNAEILEKANEAMAAEVTKVGSSVAQLACTKASSLPGAAKGIAMSKCASAG